MPVKIRIHNETPQQKRVFETVDALRGGAVCLLPTETRYSLACLYSNKKGLDRIRSIRNLDKNHTFTLLIDNMVGLSRFAHISDANYKLIKRLIPGPYTFILPATKEVPRLLVNPKRKTIGFRVTSNTTCEYILRELAAPLLAVSAVSGHERDNPDVVFEREELFEQFDRQVDLIIDNDQPLNDFQTTVLDLTTDQVAIIRKGSDFDKVEEVFGFLNYDILEEDID